MLKTVTIYQPGMQVALVVVGAFQVFINIFWNVWISVWQILAVNTCQNIVWVRLFSKHRNQVECKSKICSKLGCQIFVEPSSLAKFYFFIHPCFWVNLNSQVDLSSPSNLHHRVRFPSTTSMLFNNLIDASSICQLKFNRYMQTSVKGILIGRNQFGLKWIWAK